MKRIVTLLSLLFVFTLSFAQEAKKVSSWDYPIKPDTPAWQKLEDNVSKVGVSQIPESVLNKLSTEELFHLVLDYPLIYDIFAFNDINIGIQKLYNDFNGIRELFKRKDVSNIFVDRYAKEISEVSAIVDSKILNPVERGHAVMSLSLLEALFTYREFLDVIPTLEKEEIARVLENGYLKKKEMPEHFKGTGFETSIKALNILNKDVAVKADILSQSSPYSDYRISVVTPFGTPLTAWIMEEDPYDTRASLDAKYSLEYPDAIKVITYDGLSSTRKFNCHGYAWHRVEHGNTSAADVWIGYNPIIDGDPEKIYTTDGSYQKRPYRTDNCKIFWSQGDHTAISIDNTWCISKWNKWPLMMHRIGDSPFAAIGLEYYYYNYNLTISGPEYIDNSVVNTYSLNNPPQGTLTWSVSNNLQIVSGQNTPQLKVKPATNGSGTGTITVSINTLTSSRNLEVNYPRVTRITGPTSGVTGQTAYFNAEPIYPTSLGQYVWSVSPYGSLSTWQYQASFNPSSSGGYSISCYFRGTSGTQSLPVTLYYSVSSGWRVNVSDKDVKIQNSEASSLFDNAERVHYSLYNQSGVIVDNGVISGNEINLNYNSLPKGIYILKIVTGTDKSETFKISF